MWSEWSFRTRIGVGFAVMAALSLAMVAVAGFSLARVATVDDDMLTAHRNQVQAWQLEAASARQVSAVRAFLLTQDPRHRGREAEAASEFEELADGLIPRLSPEAREQLATVRRLKEEGDQIEARLEAWVLEERDLEEIADAYHTRAAPLRSELRRAIEELVEGEDQRAQTARAAAEDTRRWAVGILTALMATSVILAIGLAVLLTRALSRGIGEGVQQVQSSAAELQAAAHQQASSSKAQSSAMAEITTTTRELLATSKQIAESAEQVAHIASRAEEAAEEGNTAVQSAAEAGREVRRHMDEVVGHMLDLGQKAQQIGLILDLVGELTEQTNIVAINATIEAAGAGAEGRRFAVVAEELRKLADRLGSSSKEIRGLLEEVRSAVNASVMVTEGSSKAIDVNSRSAEQLGGIFQHILELVADSAEAAREIELSTKQQTTGVEQVNSGTANASEATMETQTSARQMLDTAAQLNEVSKRMADLASGGRN